MFTIDFYKLSQEVIILSYAACYFINDISYVEHMVGANKMVIIKLATLELIETQKSVNMRD